MRELCPAALRRSRKARHVRMCPECQQPSIARPTMPGGLDFWHADCWELARSQREPVIAAARRRTAAVNDLSAYLLALRRDPELPRLSPMVSPRWGVPSLTGLSLRGLVLIRTVNRSQGSRYRSVWRQTHLSRVVFACHLRR